MHIYLPITFPPCPVPPLAECHVGLWAVVIFKLYNISNYLSIMNEYKSKDMIGI